MPGKALLTTNYFDVIRKKPDRVMISDIWIQRVMNAPVARVTQEDGRIRIWGRIAEANNRYLRVILLEDGKTVHNAFFDRGFVP